MSLSSSKDLSCAEKKRKQEEKKTRDKIGEQKMNVMWLLEGVMRNINEKDIVIL